MMCTWSFKLHLTDNSQTFAKMEWLHAHFNFLDKYLCLNLCSKLRKIGVKAATFLLSCLRPKAGFFHRFCCFKKNRISETLSLGEKSLSLAKYPFILMEEIWNFPWKKARNKSFWHLCLSGESVEKWGMGNPLVVYGDDLYNRLFF